MSNINIQALDFIDDPFLVKEAVAENILKEKLPTREEIQKLSGDYVGLRILTEQGIQNKFPLHTPANVFLSLKAFEKNAYKLCKSAQELVAIKLKRAGAFDFAPSEQFKKLAEQAESNPPMERLYPADEVLSKKKPDMSKVADLDSSFFGVISKDGAKKYPLYNQYLVKTAEEFFDANYKTLNPPIRKEFAEKIKLNASRFGHIVKSAAIMDYAAQEYSPNFELYLQSRKVFMGGNREVDKLATLAKTLDPFRFVKLLEEFDKQAGLNRYYDSQFPDAYGSVFGLTKKAEAEVTIGGNTVTASILQKFANSEKGERKIAELLGTSALKDFKSAPFDVFTSLPKPHKEQIIDYINEAA